MTANADDEEEDPDLFDNYDDSEEEESAPVRKSNLLKAIEFRAKNPIVMDLINRFCSEAIAAGVHRCGIKLIWERMRWESLVVIRGEDGFKLPNNLHAHFARFWLEEHPEHPDFFETLELRVP